MKDHTIDTSGPESGSSAVELTDNLLVVENVRLRSMLSEVLQLAVESTKQTNELMGIIRERNETIEKLFLHIEKLEALVRR